MTTANPVSDPRRIPQTARNLRLATSKFLTLDLTVEQVFEWLRPIRNS
ncbi:hypothetical protein [Nostoc sp. DSM 114160]